MFQRLDNILKIIDNLIIKIYRLFNDLTINLLIIFLSSLLFSFNFYVLTEDSSLFFIMYFCVAALQVLLHYNRLKSNIILKPSTFDNYDTDNTFIEKVRLIVGFIIAYGSFYGGVLFVGQYPVISKIIFLVAVVFFVIIPLLLALFKLILQVSKKEPDFDDISMKLMLQVVKAENSVSELKLDFLKKNFTKYFVNKTSADFNRYKTILDTEIDINPLCSEICYFNTDKKLKLLYHLFSIATIDSNLTDFEENLLIAIAQKIGIPKSTYRAVKKMFAGKYYQPDYSYQYQQYTVPEIPDIKNAYHILGISPQASNTEIKHTFRELAKQCHPDKFATLGAEIILQTTEQFSRIEEAYEAIKKERNLK